MTLEALLPFTRLLFVVCLHVQILDPSHFKVTDFFGWTPHCQQYLGYNSLGLNWRMFAEKTHFTLLKTTFLEVFFLEKEIAKQQKLITKQILLDLESFEKQNWAGARKGRGFGLGNCDSVARLVWRNTLKVNNLGFVRVGL